MNNMSLLVSLDEVRGHDSRVVGGKAAPLGALRAAGFPTPPGLCVTVAAFHLALQPYAVELAAILRHANPQEPMTAVRIGLALEQLVLPPGLMNAISQALPALGGPAVRLAVRSSATLEDQATASLAGQYLTVLGVTGLAALEAAIVACWRSFFSRNALVAQAQHGLIADNSAGNMAGDRLNSIMGKEGMAVLIQPLIEANCAGVCFSVDPVQGDESLAVVEASWGLGVGVVDGLAPVDTAWVRRRNFVVARQQVVDKQTRISLDEAGVLRPTAVDPDRSSAACLPEAWLQRIAQFGVAAEVLFGYPQDVEWAITDRQIWLLQSRPITTLAPERGRLSFPVAWANEDERRSLWQLDDFPVSAHNVPLPLETESYLAVESMRTDTCRWIGVERNRQVKVVNGRTYSRPIPLELSPGDLRIRRAAQADLYQRLGDAGQTSWDLWGPEIIAATERLRRFDPHPATGPALAHHLEDALGAFRRHWMLHPLCSFNPRPAYYAAYAALSGQSSGAETAAQQLLLGEDNPLTRLIDGLYELAMLAQQTPTVATLLRQAQADLPKQLATLPEAAPFCAQLAHFLESYGERSGDGYGSNMALTARTWREQPDLVINLVARYLDPQRTAPAAARLAARQKRDAAVDALCAACADPAVVAEFRRELAVACHTLTVLEEHNHYIDQMATSQLRYAVLAAADWLTRQGVLTQQDEIFWLTFDEIIAALDKELPAALAATISDRQTQHTAWAQLTVPPLLGIPSAQLPERPPWANQLTDSTPALTRSLSGQAASPGVGRGRARVMRDLPPLLELASGDVLVAANVGPLWTPYFPLLGGLVLDGGALTQHAATTAREYGIPAVIGVRSATQRIPEGAWVTVNGNTGVVEIDDAD